MLDLMVLSNNGLLMKMLDLTVLSITVLRMLDLMVYFITELLRMLDLMAA